MADSGFLRCLSGKQSGTPARRLLQSKSHPGPGQKVEHWLNGIMVLHYTLGSERVLEAVAGSKFKNVKDFGYRHMGHVLLQDHQDEVHYRNLRIKRLRQAKK